MLRLRPVNLRYKQPFADGSKPIQYGLIAEYEPLIDYEKLGGEARLPVPPHRIITCHYFT